MSIVIDSAAQFNHLPNRVYYVLDDGRVTSVTDIIYQQLRSEPGPAWFLKTAMRRMAVDHKNKSPDDNEWGQTSTTEVTELQLDTLAPPPRDDERSLPAGTSIQNRMPQPPPAPVPDEPIVRSFSVLTIIVLAIVSVGILLFLFGMRMKKTES